MVHVQPAPWLVIENEQGNKGKTKTHQTLWWQWDFKKSQEGFLEELCCYNRNPHFKKLKLDRSFFPHHMSKCQHPGCLVTEPGWRLHAVGEGDALPPFLLPSWCTSIQCRQLTGSPHRSHRKGKKRTWFERGFGRGVGGCGAGSTGPAMQVGKAGKDSILSRQIWEAHSGQEEMNLSSGVATAVGRENQMCSLEPDGQWTLKLKQRA